MIKHIVMWKLKDNAEGENKITNANKIKKLIEDLKELISEIKFIEVGINIKEGSQAYDIVLNSEFSSLEDLDSYQKNKKHLEVAKFISKVSEERAVVDYRI
ncbi:Dabb family protein [Clostridium septicum]|uniref:Stress responsive protein n=1 Tax=Clostridium septicum TaxID=1504 RepID=A0A9N7JJ23_CLOSE|nr:Dabb family protein [Clostridium septicum]AYE33509.1 stress responsive protein [Clostridium septicum]MDU1313782.1 Dabb family protein [Clostridium septicum]QAS61675.1 Dabb family protein [Clostridium septicum]UEC21882.1 Dabb family protein [Clostridium septicum]WLF68612.1 Dabb family protein [Clostridium septicum]